MAMQNVLDRLAKISKQQTRLSKTRKVDLSLSDDLARIADSILDEINDVEGYIVDARSVVGDASDLLDKLQGAYESLEGYAKSIGSYNETLGRTLDAYENMANELGVDPFDNQNFSDLMELMNRGGVEGAVQDIDTELNVLDRLISALGSNL